MHSWRFYSKDHYFASLDSPCFAVTGALQIVDIEKFVDVGGFTPSLPTSFQDIDLCFKMIEKQIPVYYIGSEYMVHAESLTHFQQQVTKTPHFVSDNLFWDYMWGYRTSNIIGYKA
jgi:GT2 family glycosyltransferase